MFFDRLGRGVGEGNAPNDLKIGGQTVGDVRNQKMKTL